MSTDCNCRQLPPATLAAAAACRIRSAIAYALVNFGQLGATREAGAAAVASACIGAVRAVVQRIAARRSGRPIGGGRWRR